MELLTPQLTKARNGALTYLSSCSDNLQVRVRVRVRGQGQGQGQG